MHVFGYAFFFYLYRMNKPLNFCLIFFVFNLIGWNDIQAQTNIQTTIGSFNSSTCAVGDTIVLPITVNMASGISTAAISMAIDYDTTKIRCISSVTNLNTNIATGFLSNCGFFTSQNPNPPFTASSRRQFRAAWFNLVPVAFNGLMFNLRFVVVATGNSSVKWDVATPGNCEYADELADVIPNCSFVDGSITCGSAAPVNCGITLSSASSTNSQSICQGSTITNITYATTTATGATVTGLPVGVTGVWAANAVTISGTPTASGTFNYTVTLTGCTGGTSTAIGTIVVTEPPAAGTLSGNQSICVTGTTAFASTVSGGSWSSSATGVATVNATTGLVTGIAAGTATITYTVTGTGGCANATATRTVTVNLNNTITLSSASGTNAQTVTVNTAITNITYSTTGATGATISGLPAGVTGSWASNTVTISGTPSTTGTFNYAVSMTGGCISGNNTASGSITINSGGGGNFNIQTNIGSFNSSTCTVGDTIVLPISVNMASGISTAAISMAIDYDTTKLRCISSVTSLNANIATGFLSNCGFFNGMNPNPPYTSSSRRQFRAAWFNLVPVSFNGVMFNLRFVVESTGNSVIKWDLVNPGNCEYADEIADVIPNCSFVDGSITCGSAAPVNCGITHTSAAGTNSQSICQGSAITNITYATTAATGATVTGLPAGVTGFWASNAVTISGTPTATGTFNYTVTLSGCTGGTSTATGTITVAAPTSTGTLSGTQSICIAGTTTFASTVSGGSWSSSATGVATVNASTGVVTGVAAGTATITYTVTGTGGCANATATRTVTVTAPTSAGTLSGMQSICVNGTTTFASTVSGGSWSSSATGVATVNASTGVVTGVAAGTATITYTVTGTGGCANTTATRTVTVTAPTSAGTLSGTQSICVNGTTTFASTVSGGSWSSSATGVATVNATTGLVTGIAAGTATITYTVTGTGGCSDATATRTVTVTAPPTAGTLSGNQSICVTGTTAFASTVSGGSWSSSATGVATVNATTGLVTGIAAGTATITYTVTGTGGCSDATATRTLTVNPNSSSILSDTICQGTTYLFGTLALTSSGTYNRTLPSSNGCDSLITLNLVVINKPQAPSISVSGTVDTLFAIPGNRVTWFRNGAQIGAGSTGFIPITQNGQYYALRDTSVGSRICYSDTSNHLNLSNVGIGEQLGQSKLLRVYPVPASDIIYLEGIEDGFSLELQVFDLSGRRVTSLNFNSTDVENRVQVNTSELPAGMYQLFLKGNQWSTVQLIKFSILR